jgi:hypothetical protein
VVVIWFETTQPFEFAFFDCEEQHWPELHLQSEGQLLQFSPWLQVPSPQKVGEEEHFPFTQYPPSHSLTEEQAEPSGFLITGQAPQSEEQLVHVSLLSQ